MTKDTTGHEAAGEAQQQQQQRAGDEDRACAAALLLHSPGTEDLQEDARVSPRQAPRQVRQRGQPDDRGHRDGARRLRHHRPQVPQGAHPRVLLLRYLLNETMPYLYLKL